jgi:hypothetical protein
MKITTKLYSINLRTTLTNRSLYYKNMPIRPTEIRFSSGTPDPIIAAGNSPKEGYPYSHSHVL